MGKIINQSLEEKSIPNSIDELELSFQAEIRIDDLDTKGNGLMPLYDDEIGLWEALESRYRRRAQASV